ncbi:hypothetical protein GT370_12345 [Acidocella sp. MX-AZ03]|nr:hypothetical protein [Acidocella sp. MX-AZ03]WBO58051.1 hypothetical protein GT370_12345 [Acidocella sp. MX-AZ03]
MIEARLHARFQADGALRAKVIARAEAGTLPADALAGFLRLGVTLNEALVSRLFLLFDHPEVGIRRAAMLVLDLYILPAVAIDAAITKLSQDPSREIRDAASELRLKQLRLIQIALGEKKAKTDNPG